jgi:ubiquinone/menaquinone biosynthesis C-methylase UbiE
LFLVLENEPVSNRVHLKTYLKKNLKNTRLSPSIQSHYTFVVGTPDQIPLPDHSQKTVLCRKVIHDFSNVSKMAAEMARIMSKGGTLIVVEPDPVLSGTVDPRSEKMYFSKIKIDSLFRAHSLQLVSTDTIDYEMEVLNIMKFTK